MDDNQNVLLARVESAAIDGRMKTLRIRQRLLQSLHKHLLQHRVAFLEATQIDDGCSKEEAQIIFAAALIELRNHYDALNLTTDLDLEYSLAKEKDNEARRVPFDIAYIIPDTSAVLFSILSALCAAIEAGSCVVVEVSDFLQSSLVCKLHQIEQTATHKKRKDSDVLSMLAVGKYDTKDTHSAEALHFGILGQRCFLRGRLQGHS